MGESMGALDLLESINSPKAKLSMLVKTQLREKALISDLLAYSFHKARELLRKYH